MNDTFMVLAGFVFVIAVCSVLPVYLFRNKFYSKAEMVVWGIIFLFFPFFSVLLFLVIKLSFPRCECQKENSQ
ncbi:hypothetical protein [Alteromonas gilva]|uniref:Cardiolipin synthase N-terminal domain-containing protein n=1 Tax=Alteromonas gilva TaxID=2987522 RepID=A0ABT5KYJ0_9ALTE|nr:hypothetical protein [Alteromonas gilva]MDC8829844.1 hypothetical protein [Alteromonas gilva]